MLIDVLKADFNNMAINCKKIEIGTNKNNEQEKTNKKTDRKISLSRWTTYTNLPHMESDHHSIKVNIVYSDEQQLSMGSQAEVLHSTSYLML